MTQEGISQAAGIDVPHFAQYVRPLVREGLVRERTAHVKGVRRRRKVYDLTESGKMASIQFRESIRGEIVRIRDPKGVREASVSQILTDAGGKASLLGVVRQVMETGTVDLTGLPAISRRAFVEMLSGAPRIDMFVGRRAELDAITSESETPRLFVVRGVAGIGKSSLGGKATELLRGKRNLFWHRTRPWDTTSSILARLAEFLSALGRPGLRSVLSRGETSRAAEILREDLPGTQAFLVFDDAHEGGEEVIAFLRLLKEAMEQAADVRALILSRKALPFYDRRDVVLAKLMAEVELSGLDSQEAAALLAPEPEALGVVEVARRLGGHPLFLRLVKPHGAAPPDVRDVKQFIKEEIYDKLSGDERIIMKTASQYAVPVPRDALFPTPDLSHDILFSLSDRSLLRSVGEDRFEVHDTVRDFFAGLLTPSEQRKVGEFAVEQLRRYASEARDAGNFVASIGFLSNALQLSTSPLERQAIWEALGDAYVRIRDVPSAEKAFRESMAMATEPEVLARLHRKLAFAYSEWGEPKAAAGEVEAGLQTLGEAFNVERAWLNLALGFLAWTRDEIREAQEHAELALRIFQELGDTAGQARALEELGGVASRQGSQTPDGKPLADQYYKTALELTDAAKDPVFAARIHVSLLGRIGNTSGNVAEMAKHLRAIEAIPKAMEDPFIRADFITMRGWVRYFYEGDFSGAGSDFDEGLRLAQQMRAEEIVAGARGMLAMIAYAEGQTIKAREGFEQALAEDLRRRDILGAATDILYAAECYLAEGDANGFRRIAATLEDRRLVSSQPDIRMYADMIRALESLVDGDDANARTLFDSAVRIAENLPGEAWTRPRAVGKAHFLHSVALRVMEQEQEAEEHMKRALEGWGVANLQAFLTTAADRARRLVEGLQRIRSTQSPKRSRHRK